MARMRRCRRPWHTLLLACAGTCLSTPAAWRSACAAEPPQTTGTNPVTHPAAAKAAAGALDLSGLLSAQPATPGPISFSAIRATTWNEGPLRRLLLDESVKVTLAGHRFEAKKAAVFMQRTEREGLAVEQVFLYFEHVTSTAPGGIAINSPLLPVRAVITPTGVIELSADLITHGRPPSRTPMGAFADKADQSLAAALARLPRSPVPQATGESAATANPSIFQSTPPVPPVGPPAPGESQGLPVAPPATLLPPAPGPTDPTAGAELREPIFSSRGIITVAAPDVTVVSGEDENAVIITGGVTLQYEDRESARTLQLSAQRAVIFLDPGPLTDTTQFSAAGVRGIFLEGGVIAGDGKYSVRAPEVFYDVRNNKAVMLDAVFWTYDEQRRLPLYVRAKSIRQESAEQFIAKSATMTNSAFFDPELSIGASTVTISRRQRPIPQGGLDAAPPGTPTPTETQTLVEARNFTLRALGIPIFYWPYYSGDPTLNPIRDVRFENRSGSGGAIKATINAYSLIGLRRPGDTRFDLLTDYFFERGPALGTRIAWNKSNSRGDIFAYGVLSDQGTDLLKPGTRIERDGEFRGIVTGEQRWKVDEKWTIFAEIAYIQDETFVDAFFEDLGESRREFTNRIVGRRLAGNTSLAIEAKGTFQQFLANEYLLQSQGYAVTKIPEATYVRLADDLLDGRVSYSSEYRAGWLALSFDEPLAREHGFTTNSLAQRALGINADQSLAQALEARGYSEDDVARFDTRHEVSINENLGPVRLTPFVVGRITAYNDDFDSFAPAEDDQTRLWGAAGVRLSTTVQRIYESAQWRALDIHRLRHIIEPNATLWHAGTNIDGRDLPVYDDAVESLAEGSMYRIGVNQTFQTQRGGPGRWHNVDLLSVNTDYVHSSGDTDTQGPIGRFFDFRPELSNPGDYLVADAIMRVTDATSLTGNTVFDFDLSQQATTSVGLLMRHAPGFVTIGDIRYLNAQDTTFVNMGAFYDLSTKYSVTAAASYNVDESQFQTMAVELRRRFSSSLLGLHISYNEITGETSFGFILQPYGASKGAGISGIGGADIGSRFGG